MLPRDMKYYLTRLLAFGAIIVALGWFIGHPVIVILIALSLLGLWNLFNLFRLRSWLADTSVPVPESLGLWSQVFDRLDRLEKSSLQQKENYKAVIKDFQSLTDAMPDATLVIDENDNITWFNNAARLALGLKVPDDLGQAVTNLLRDPNLADWLSVQGQIQSHLEMESPADEHTWFSVSAVHYRENQRLIILRDISEVHFVDRVRRDFVANISHELRTPLTVLLGYLEILRQEADQSAAGIAEKMHVQAVQMQDLLGDLLELSRLQSDRIRSIEEPIDVPAMLAQLKEQLEEVSQGKHALHFHVQEKLFLSGVAADIESAFRNLLLNAVRYTPEGGKIRVTWKSQDSGAVFLVADSGIGIPKRDIPRLTERFFRVQTDRARQSGGTGLGLSIVKHVLKAHQARLKISSELGQGSEFVCYFPEDRIRRKSASVEARAS